MTVLLMMILRTWHFLAGEIASYANLCLFVLLLKKNLRDYTLIRLSAALIRFVARLIQFAAHPTRFATVHFELSVIHFELSAIHFRLCLIAQALSKAPINLATHLERLSLHHVDRESPHIESATLNLIRVKTHCEESAHTDRLASGR